MSLAPTFGLERLPQPLDQHRLISLGGEAPRLQFGAQFRHLQLTGVEDVTHGVSRVPAGVPAL